MPTFRPPADTFTLIVVLVLGSKLLIARRRYVPGVSGAVKMTLSGAETANVPPSGAVQFTLVSTLLGTPVTVAVNSRLSRMDSVTGFGAMVMLTKVRTWMVAVPVLRVSNR